MGAARDAAYTAALAAKLGREPTHAELQMKKEATRKMLLKAEGGAAAEADAARDRAALERRRLGEQLKRRAAVVLSE